MAPEPATDMPNRALGPATLLGASRPFDHLERDALITLALGQPDQTRSQRELAALGDAELVAAAGFRRLVG